MQLISTGSNTAARAARTLADTAIPITDNTFLVSPREDAECSGVVDPENWPFDADAILRQISLNLEAVETDYSRQTILVLDTGFDTASVPERWTHIRNGMLRRIPSQARPTELVDGLNLASPSASIMGDDNDDLRWHGLAVAEIALGSSQFHDYRSVVEALPTVAIASAVSIGRIQSSSIQNAYEYASDHNLPIINVSFLTGTALPSFEATLSRHGNSVLLVVAAGNDAQSLDRVGGWPASLGGSGSLTAIGSVITVGSHDPNGSISEFSRFGRQTVDLLAPGCGVRAIISTLSESDATDIYREVSGTSFAAPAVSFVAAILRGFGLQLSAIKERLIISADFSNDLDDLVYSRGILNAEDAIAYPFVVYRFAEQGHHRRILARLSQQRYPVTLCGREYLLHELHRISRREERDGPTMLHVWPRSLSTGFGHRPLERGEYCELREGDTMADARIVDALSGNEIALDLSTLRDLILPLD